jgi:hypothetical protein
MKVTSPAIQEVGNIAQRELVGRHAKEDRCSGGFAAPKHGSRRFSHGAATRSSNNRAPALV